MSTRKIEILHTAAEALQSVRYDTIPDNEQRPYLDALSELLTEVTHLVDELNHDLPPILEPARSAAGLDGRIAKHLPINAELLLTTLVQRQIDQLDNQADTADTAGSIIRDVPTTLQAPSAVAVADQASGWVAVHETTGDRGAPRPTPHEAILSLASTLWTQGTWTLQELATLDRVANEIRQLSPSPGSLDLYLTGTSIRLEPLQPARQAA